jgi:tetratricopeptide (TPR) repeat protein
LTGFLRARPVAGLDDDQREAWRRAFVVVMWLLSSHLTPKGLHEQRWPFHWHGVNFLTALAEAEALKMDTYFADLTQALGSYAWNLRDFDGAEQWFAALVEYHKQGGQTEGEAVAYHQLGIIAQERRNFAAAEQWHHKSLAIKEKQGNEHGAASTYHDLGVIAGLQNHFVESGRWLVRAIVGFSHQQDTHYAKITVDIFLIIYRQAPPDDQAKLRQIWEEAGLGAFPESGDQAAPAK